MCDRLMRKATLLVALSCLIVSSATLATDFNVGAGQSIQRAIDQASKGDRIILAEGTYREPITLKCGVHLQGAGAARTTIDSPGFYPAVTARGVDEVTVTGITIRCPSSSAQAAIYLESSTAAFLQCEVVGGRHSIAAVEGSTIAVEECSIHESAGNGIGVWDSVADIVNCEIGSHDYNGIGASSADVTVEDTVVRDNGRAGVHFDDNTRGVAEQVTAYRNASAGIAITGGAVAEAKYCTVYANKFGILVNDGGDGLIERCIVYGNSASGLFIADPTQLGVDHNTVAGNDQNGMYVLRNASPTITCNIIAFNAGNGIDITSEDADPGRPKQVEYNVLFANLAGNYDGLDTPPLDLAMDPQFASQEQDDFRLRPTSPCRGADSLGEPVGAISEVIPLSEDPVMDWTKLFNTRPALEFRHVEGGSSSFSISLGLEAANLAFVMVASETELGGYYEGGPVDVGPVVFPIGEAGSLDETGAAEVSYEWPEESAADLVVQILIAATREELEQTGCRVAIEPTRITRYQPSQKQEQFYEDAYQIVSSCPCIDYGDDYTEYWLTQELQVAPTHLITPQGSSLDLAFSQDGYAMLSPSSVPSTREQVALLAVDVPMRFCCEHPELHGIEISYKSATEGDTIKTIQLGYLNDDGSFTELAIVHADLASLSWRRSTFEFDGVLIFSPLIIRVFFALGGGMNFGNTRLVLAPANQAPSTGEAAIGTPLCAKLLTCMPGSGFEDFNEWSCADGLTWLCAPGTTAGRVVGFLFQNRCDEEITFGKLEVRDDEGNVVWENRATPVSLGTDTPFILLGVWNWGEIGVWNGSYTVALDTSVGTFRKGFRITDLCE